MKTSIFHRGTEIVKIENEYPEIFGYECDFIYVSRGFVNAIEHGLTPTTELTLEFHHYFTKDEEYGFKSHRINFI